MQTHKASQVQNRKLEVFLYVFNYILILKFIFKKVFNYSPWIFFYIHYITKKNHYTNGTNCCFMVTCCYLLSLLLYLSSLSSQK